MGMFNSIYADLLCPVKGEVTKDAEIQIKWQVQEARALTAYRLGDTLDEIEERWNDTWIRTDYICDVCSEHSIGWKGMSFIRTEDQVWHHVFVKIENGKIVEISTEEEFVKARHTEFVKYW